MVISIPPRQATRWKTQMTMGKPCHYLYTHPGTDTGYLLIVRPATYGHRFVAKALTDNGVDRVVEDVPVATVEEGKSMASRYLQPLAEVA